MTLNEIKGKCVICSNEAVSRCSACSQVFYCSVEHQKADWKKHKNLCRPYKECQNTKVGRYLIAARNIKAGEIIIRESAILKGPSQITRPVCVGCLESVDEKDCLECEKCGWPVCSRECQDNPDHKAECEFTVTRGSKVKIQHFLSPHPTYQCLTTLRALLLKDRAPGKWAKLMELESHADDRIGTNQWRSDRASIAQFIPRFFKCDGKWTEEEILKVTGILQINGHEVPLTEPSYVAVFSNASMVEHSCSPNVTKSFSPAGDVIFWAPRAINKGENLSISYTDVLWGTLNRRVHLKQTKMFDCECKRCLDRTEFGTYFSALKCMEADCKGFILPKKLYTADTLWECLNCAKDYEPKHAADILERAAKDFEFMNRDNIEHCTRYIEHYSKWLVPNHYRLIQVKVILVQLIGGGGAAGMQAIDDADLQRKLLLANELINLLDTLVPSESRLLGTIHFELHATLAEVARRETQKGNSEFKLILQESLVHAERTLKFLKHEPDVLPEGLIAKQARINLESLKVLLASAAS